MSYCLSVDMKSELQSDQTAPVAAVVFWDCLSGLAGVLGQPVNHSVMTILLMFVQV